MPFNLLLIPLLGGYFFVRFWNRTRIHMLRADKDRMLIRASLVGFFSLILAFAISIAAHHYLPDDHPMFAWWRANVPFPYVGVSLLAFLICVLPIPILNLIWTEEGAIDQAIAEDADPFEICLKRSKDIGVAVAITLDDGKVYVGVVTHQFNPALPTKTIAILPLKSGYRDADDRRINLPVNYSDVYQKMRGRLDELSDAIAKLETDRAAHSQKSSTDPAAQECTQRIDKLQADWADLEKRMNNFEVVIPVSQIRTIANFDQSTYKEYFEPKSTEKKLRLVTDGSDGETSAKLKTTAKDDTVPEIE